MTGQNCGLQRAGLIAVTTALCVAPATAQSGDNCTNASACEAPCPAAGSCTSDAQCPGNQICNEATCVPSYCGCDDGAWICTYDCTGVCSDEGFGNVVIGLVISPEAPQPGDAVTIRAIGLATNQCFSVCAVESSWIEPNHFHFDITVHYAEPDGGRCGTDPESFRFEHDAGTLEPGLYTADGAIAAYNMHSTPCVPSHLLIDEDYSEVQFCIPLPYDFNGDCNVDLSDVAEFVTCFLKSWDLSAPLTGCSAGDFDSSDRIDLLDFAMFQNTISE